MLNDSFYDLEIDTTTQYRIYGSVLWSNINSTETINDFNMIKMKNNKNWTVPIDLIYFNQFLCPLIWVSCRIKITCLSF
jgi:hypothetical protein